MPKPWPTIAKAVSWRDRRLFWTPKSSTLTVGLSVFSLWGVMWGKSPKSLILSMITEGNGGDEGIRTLETLPSLLP